MEVTSLRHATLPGRAAPGPLLRLASDERLITLIRRGHHAAFEALVQRYQARLLSFCRHMLGSREDAEDVLQDVFAAAFNAILADEREINVRPWLYRIARNRSLNHLRRSSAVGVDSMDTYFADHGQSVPERILQRENFQALLEDIGRLAETQRTALLLREIDALSYEQIAEVMDTTVPAVKSLLVRARVALAEAAEARKLSCDDVRNELGEVAEGLIKVSPPVRRHLRDCARCRSFNRQLRHNERALAAVLPVAGLPALLHKLIATKLGSTTGAGGAYAAGSGGAGASAGTGASLAAGAGAASGVGGVGGVAGFGSGAIAAKAVASLAAAALVTAGAVEVGHGRTAHHAASSSPSTSASADGASRAGAPSLPSSTAQPSAAKHTPSAARRAHAAKKPLLSDPRPAAGLAPALKRSLPSSTHATKAATVKSAGTHAKVPTGSTHASTAHDATSPATSQVVQVTTSTVELPSAASASSTSAASHPSGSPAAPAAGTPGAQPAPSSGPTGSTGASATGATEAPPSGEAGAPTPTESQGSPVPPASNSGGVEAPPSAASQPSSAGGSERRSAAG